MLQLSKSTTLNVCIMHIIWYPMTEPVKVRYTHVHNALKRCESEHMGMKRGAAAADIGVGIVFHPWEPRTIIL